MEDQWSVTNDKKVWAKYIQNLHTLSPVTLVEMWGTW